MNLTDLDAGSLLGIPVVIFILINVVALWIVDPQLQTPKARLIGRILILILSLPVTYIFYMICLLAIASYKTV